MAPPAGPARLVPGSAPRPGAPGGRPASFWRFEGAPPPGKGKTPVLALGGLALDGRVFSRLGSLAGERDLVLANLPNDVPRDSRMEDLARVALGILDAAGHGGRAAVLMGSSFGGMAALAAAAECPERAAALVLLGTGASWAALPLRLRAASSIHALVPRRAYPRFFATVMVPNRRYSDPAVRDDLRTQMLHRTKEFIGTSIRAMKGFDAGPRLPALRAPALVLHGSLDAVFPPPASAALAAGLPRASLLSMEGVGHLPHVSRPGETAAAVAAFLEREGL